jgi:hypothetical protein
VLLLLLLLPCCCCCCCCALQVSRYQLKQWLNAATDLMRIQYMLLGGKPEYMIREHPRMRVFSKTFKRRVAMAVRR